MAMNMDRCDNFKIPPKMHGIAHEVACKQSVQAKAGTSAAAITVTFI
jgi:hypothetical protein